MSTIYVTKDGDTADLIAWNYYGALAGQALEQLLDANPGLADRGPVLPAGVSVVLPEIATTAQTPGVRLWD